MIFAKIQDNVVINIQLSDTTDNFDSNFIWVDITSLDPLPNIGWSYDGENFISSEPVLTLSKAKQQNLFEFSAAILDYTSQFYTTDIKLQFFILYYMANQNGLVNRATYIQPLFIWANSVLNYTTSYVALINSITDINQVLNTTWDIPGHTLSVPNLTPGAALLILN